MEEKKTCTKCNVEKFLPEFHKNNQAKDGLSSHCKICRNEKRRSLSYERSNLIINKKCSKCNIEKSSDDFCNDSKSKDGISSTCKVCNLQHVNDYKNENPEKVKNSAKKWRELNREKVLKYKRDNRQKAKETKRKWIENNKDRVRKTQQNYIKNKKETNLIFKYYLSIGGLVRGSFKRAIKGKFSKSQKTLEILGCSMEFFITYIQSLFTEGMTFENYGVCNVGN